MILTLNSMRGGRSAPPLGGIGISFNRQRCAHASFRLSVDNGSTAIGNPDNGKRTTSICGGGLIDERFIGAGLGGTETKQLPSLDIKLHRAVRVGFYIALDVVQYEIDKPNPSFAPLHRRILG